jgi:hypothetical protein
MSVHKNHNEPGWPLKTALVALNGAAIVMLILKLVYGSFSNDDLIAIMALVFLGNIVLAYMRRRKTTSNKKAR